MSDQPILEVKEVTKTFGGILALNRVSFHVDEGEILGIIGPNGSGKTTLINCITAFIKMTSGKVLFRGKDISGKPAHKIADMGVTRTFQIMRPYYSLPAYKNLVIPLYSPRAKRTGGWRGGGKLGDRNTVGIDILEEIGFERDSFVPYKMASTLPTGYLKRLELARCLALKPEIILCDEVFSGLSMSEIASMVPLIERLQMDGTAIIGNKELPKILYIVPWKTAEPLALKTPPFNSVLDEKFQPIERSTFRRQLLYYNELYTTSDKTP